MAKDWYSLKDIFEESKIVGEDLGNDWIYEPYDQYDSPIENEFGAEFKRHLKQRYQLQPQYEANTICGQFRVDFLIEVNGQKIGFECDGKEFHDPEHDEWRDAMILGSGSAHIIYRFKGRDIRQYLHECIYLIACWHPEIFSPRGLQRLQAIASPSIGEYALTTLAIARRSHTIELLDNPESKIREFISVGCDSVAKSRANSPERQPRWRTLYQYAETNGGGNIDVLRDRYFGVTSRSTVN